MKRIACISPNVKNHGLPWQRLRKVFRYLPRDKYDIRFIDLEDYKDSDIEWADMLVMCHVRHLAQLKLARRAKVYHGIKVVVDIDDLLDVVPRYHYSYQMLKENYAAEIVRISDMVVTSTQYLLDHYSKYNKNIVVIENSVDARQASASLNLPPQHRNTYVIGYTGAEYHKDDLYVVKDALRMMLVKYPDVRLHFHLATCAGFEDMSHRVVINEKTMDYYDYNFRLSQYPFDLCVVPLIPHRFNEAKSDLRFLEMSLAKVPVLASNRVSYVRNKARNLCVTVDDSDWNSDPNRATQHWFNALEYMYKNRALARTMADSAHDYVLRDRNSVDAARDWDFVLEGVETMQPRRLLLRDLQHHEDLDNQHSKAPECENESQSQCHDTCKSDESQAVETSCK